MELESDQKAAILLQSLGDDAVQPALQGLDDGRAERLRQKLDELKNAPADPEDVEAVIADFERFFRFALKAAGAESFWSKFAEENPELTVRDFDSESSTEDDDADDEETDSDSSGDRQERSNKRSRKKSGARRGGGARNGEPGDDEEDWSEGGSYGPRGRARVGPKRAGAAGSDAAEDEPQLDATEADDEPQFRIFQPTDDALADLQKLHPQQVAGALKLEQPKTIALVLGCLPEPQAAEVMTHIADDKQNSVFDIMLAGASAPESLLQRIVQATVAKGLAIEKPEAKEPEPREKVAGLLRELPRELRGKMMEHLAETDPEKAESMQSLLYLFEDILRYTDRSIQKVLAEVDKVALTNSLQGADPDIKDKLLRNLSKRARDTLLEELEFSQKQPEQVVSDARKAITDVLAKLDAADQIEMEE